MGNVSKHLLEQCLPRFRNIIRREISPGTVHVGQIVQVKMCFRLLKQEDDTFVYREMLKSVCVLHDGVSMVSFRLWCV